MRNASRVIVLLYKDIIHSLGGATETGEIKVMIFMEVCWGEVVVVEVFGGVDVDVLQSGDARDHTGIERGGGGGMDGDANARDEDLNWFCCTFLDVFEIM